MTPEQAFHAQRRMFVFFGVDILVAPAGSTLSHAEWFEAEGLTRRPHWSDNLVRGFVDPRGVFLYEGDFRNTLFVRRVARSRMDMLKHVLDLTGREAVHYGLVKGLIGTPWEPAHTEEATVDGMIAVIAARRDVI